MADNPCMCESYTVRAANNALLYRQVQLCVSVMRVGPK